MVIFVTLNKIDIGNLDLKEIVKLIGEKAKKLIVKYPTDQIHITLNDTKTQNTSGSIPDSTFVLVQVFSDFLLNNSG